MSDFIMVVPPGWVEFPTVNELLDVGATPAGAIYSNITEQQWTDLDYLLRNAAMLPEGKTVSNAKLVQTDNGYHLWLQFSA